MLHHRANASPKIAPPLANRYAVGQMKASRVATRWWTRVRRLTRLGRRPVCVRGALGPRRSGTVRPDRCEDPTPKLYGLAAYRAREPHVRPSEGGSIG